MRQDGSEVRECREHDERAYESVERRLTTNVDAAEQSTNDRTQHDRVKWVSLLLVDVSEEAAEWSSVVASQSPEYAAGG